MAYYIIRANMEQTLPTHTAMKSLELPGKWYSRRSTRGNDAAVSETHKGRRTHNSTVK